MITAENLINIPLMQDPKFHVTQEYLKERMIYKKGKMYWKTYKGNSEYWNGRYAGKQVGTYSPSRKNHGTLLKGHAYAVHRLVWIYHNGPISKADRVLHYKDSTDDSIENLYLIKRG